MKIQFSNPLSTKAEMEALSEEIAKDSPDTERMTDIAKKVKIKRAAQSFLAITTLGVTALAVVKTMQNSDEENDEATDE